MVDGPNNWRPENCFRLPNWRWQQASWLAEQGERPKGLDNWVRRARRYLASAPDGGHERRPRSGRTDLAVAGAISLSTEEPPHRRWLVEALLLTDETLEGIACKSGLSVKIVEGYHQLFFDVRPRLGAIDWVMLLAINPCCAQGFDGQPLGSIWKFAGFSGGVRVLEVVVAVTMDQPLPAWIRESLASKEQPADEEERIRGKVKLLVAALTTPPGATFKGIIDKHMQLQRKDRRAGRMQDRADGIVPLMEDFLVRVAGPGKPKKTGSRPRSRKQALRLPTQANPDTLISSLREALESIPSISRAAC